MSTTERRVYRSRSARRWPSYLAVALVALLVAGVVYELAGLPRVAAEPPLGGGFVSDATPDIVLRVIGLTDPESLHVTLDDRDVTAQAEWDGELLTIAGIELEDGAHTVRVRADSSNLIRRRLDERLTFTVDTTAPTIRLDPDTADGTLTTSPPEVTGMTEPRARVEVTGGPLPAMTYADADGRFVLRPDLEPGPATLLFTARDWAGNATAEALAVYVDATVPTLSVDTVPKTVRRATLTVRMTAADVEASPAVTAVIDGAPARVTGGAGAARLRLSHLAQGQHRLVVTATDGGGNRARVRTVFVVDSTERFGAAALWRGARGRDVRDLQALLRARGLYGGTLSGTYDAATAAGVESFQERYGLAVDGRVAGETLNALSGRIVVDLSELTLRFYRAGKLVTAYRVAAGQSAYPTPTGTYAVVRMIVDPTWYPPDSEWAKDAKPIPPGIENPLGTRWIGTSAPAVGIHGTPDDGSIGTYASHGCIRMHIPNVEDLYERVALGMTVVIQP